MSADEIKNRAYAVALHRMDYDFVRIHQKLWVTAGVTDKLWEVGDIAKLVEDAETPPKKRGPYRKRTA